LNVAVIITAGAVTAFFSVVGWISRGAYFNGYAAGFSDARDRFERLLKVAGARELYKEVIAEFDRENSQ
jgi:hypothetical protein